MKRFSWMAAFSDVRVVLAKFNLGWIKHYRLSLTIGVASFFAGAGLGMILGLLGRAPEDDRAQFSPSASVSIVIGEEEARLPPIIKRPPTEEETLEKMVSQGFTLEEPDGDPPVEITEFGETVYFESLPFTPPSDAPKADEKQQQLAVVMRPLVLNGVEADAIKPTWLRHAVAVPDMGQDNRPLIAIVVDDLGLNRRMTAMTTALTPPLTLAFLTYADDLERQTGAARKAGHELLVHVPMEPLDSTYDPGPKALMSGMDSKEINRLLDWDLTRFDGFVGLNNHMGSKFTANREGMKTVIRELRKRGLLYLDSQTTEATKGLDLARELGVPYAVRNVFLDNVISVDAVLSRLADLEQVARDQGFAVGICHPYQVTLEALAEWIDTLGQRGFSLVPISAIVLRRMELAARP
jgi:polysaccharide deacetylase 2 family uncharacterized protein YibQ